MSASASTEKRGATGFLPRAPNAEQSLPPPLQLRSPPPLSQLVSPPEEPSQLSLLDELPEQLSPLLESPEHEPDEVSLLPSQLSLLLVSEVLDVPEQPQLTSSGRASIDPDPLESLPPICPDPTPPDGLDPPTPVKIGPPVLPLEETVTPLVLSPPLVAPVPALVLALPHPARSRLLAARTGDTAAPPLKTRGQSTPAFPAGICDDCRVIHAPVG
jgi:hypothetical protein